MKKVLITGATGFIGRHCLPFLMHQNCEVHAVYLNTPGAEGKNIFWHQGDLLDSNQIDDLIEMIRPTHLLHMAWFARPGEFWNSTENLRWVQASLELLQKFTENGGQRAVIAGTCAEYDWQHEILSEEVTPLHPKTLYGVCKNSLQTILAEYSKQVGLALAWGRIFFIYGPFENPSRLVPSVINSLILGKPALCSHGNQIRDFLYVSDAAEAFTTLLDSDIQGPINIASGKPVSLKEIILKTAEKLGRKDLIRLGAIPSPDNDPPFLVGDTKRLSNQLSWSPKYDLESGLGKTISWWKNQVI